MFPLSCSFYRLWVLVYGWTMLRALVTYSGTAKRIRKGPLLRNWKLYTIPYFSWKLHIRLWLSNWLVLSSLKSLKTDLPHILVNGCQFWLYVLHVYQVAVVSFRWVVFYYLGGMDPNGLSNVVWGSVTTALNFLDDHMNNRNGPYKQEFVSKDKTFCKCRADNSASATLSSRLSCPMEKL